MAVKEVAMWLEGKRDFATGSQLYNKYGDDRLLKRVLARSGATAYNKNLLEDAMEALYAGMAPQGAVLVPPVPATEVKDEKKLPDELLALLDRKGQLLREASMLKNALETMDLPERIAAIATIKKHWDEVDAIWKCRDDYEATGVFASYVKAAPEIDIPVDKVQLMRFITNISTRISKCKKPSQEAKKNKLIAAREEARRRMSE